MSGYQEGIMKVLLLIAVVAQGSEPSVHAIEMTTLAQCSEVRAALYMPGRILMCIESVIPLPKPREVGL